MYDILSGIQVVEVAMWAFVPAAGAVLSEWGAEVVKVVHPEYGDPMQGAPVGDLPPVDVDVAFMWEILNRGKRCIGINLADPDGRAVLDDLVRNADVFVTNFLPDARQRLAIDVEDIRAINPKIIYARGSGHGVRGPEHADGGYDHTSFWARSGIAHAAAMVTGEFIPQPGPAMGDLLSGFSLAAGITGALLRRERTGKPSVVDVSLLGTAAFAFSPSVVASELYDVPTIPRSSHAKQPNPLVTCYTTQDGRQIYLAGLRTDQHWKEFCELVGHPKLGVDERFSEGPERLKNAHACIEVLDQVFGEKSLEEWKEVLVGMTTPWAIIQSAQELHDDQQVKANGYLVPVVAASGSTFHLVANPVQFDEVSPSLTRAPDHAEHTDEVLLETGRDWDEIMALKIKGAVS
jgi:crotonobetainyl-CoA:carnitine CoA-transferase CaiB-like acyl-CoA transferase